MDLADAAERLQMAGQFRTAHRDADEILAIGQRPHQVAAEETRAAEHGDQRVKFVFTAIAGRTYRIGFALYRGVEHDPEKWRPVFGKDHAQTKC